MKFKMHLPLLVVGILILFAFVYYCSGHHIPPGKAKVVAAALLPFAILPGRRHKDDIRRRVAGSGLIAYNEIPAGTPAPGAGAGTVPAGAIDPASVVISSPQGVVAAGNALPAGVVPPDQSLVATNASAALALVPDQRLTAFSVGYPTDDLEILANFFAPQVPAALKFSYKNHSKANAFGVVQDDGIGVNGLPQIVAVDPATLSDGTLQFRGLETQMFIQEETAYNNIPGGSAEMEWQDRLEEIINWSRRGRLQRIIAAAAAAAGGATGKTWSANQNNPLTDLDTEITALAKLAGGKRNIRVLIGATAWNIIKYHKICAGDGTNNKVDPATLQWLADKLEIPVGNIHVSYLQAETAKQGKTNVVTDLFTAAEIYLYPATQNPSRRSPDFMKTFVMGGRSVYAFQPHPLITRRGYSNWEKVVVTNASAVKRLTIS